MNLIFSSQDHRSSIRLYIKEACHNFVALLSMHACRVLRQIQHLLWYFLFIFIFYANFMHNN